MTEPADYTKMAFDYINTACMAPNEIALNDIKTYIQRLDLKEGSHLVIIAAIDEKSGIGKNGQIPWHVPEDKLFFKTQTMGFPVLVARRTYQSWGGHPLEGRPCAVWTRNPDLIKDSGGGEDFIAGKDLSSLIKWCRERSHTIYVCGGSMLYGAVSGIATDLIISRIKGDYKCDVLFPDIFDDFELDTSVNLLGLNIDHYVRKTSPVAM